MMFHTDLLRIINEREAWAFVGAGASVDAGCLTWTSLFGRVVEELSANKPGIQGDAAIETAFQDGDMPRAFALLEDACDRAPLEAVTKRVLAETQEPGELHRILADLPFKGYITTNYDTLLERALNDIDPGWISVGNVGDEVRKVSGSADRVVWHIHGSVDLGDQESRLTLTSEDYAQLYLDDSRILAQLKGLLSQKRAVFFGFGFRDHDVLELLRRVGRMTDVNRPLYAFCEKGIKPFRHTIDRQMFLTQFRVDVHPYSNDDQSHRGLRDIIRTYGALSVRRSLRYGKSLTSPPSYDPETTGILLYNELVLNSGMTVPDDIRTSLLRSRILALVHSRSETSSQDLIHDISSIAAALQSTGVDTGTASSADAVLAAVAELQAEGLLRSDSSTDSLDLSDSGSQAVLQHSATAQRLERQFSASLNARVRAMELGPGAASVERVIAAFFRDAIRRRALGIAMAFATKGTADQQDYHALALVQSVRDWLDRADSERDALAVVECILGVFRDPTDVEARYIGLAIQAVFGLHLLGLDPDTLSVRRRELQRSLIVVDANTLIPWLARGSSGHEPARLLLSRLRESGARVIATRLLAEEVAEHARWAERQTTEHGEMSAEVFEHATGRAGARTNAFLAGFVALRAEVGGPSTFKGYLSTCLGFEAAGALYAGDVISALEADGIRVVNVDASATDDLRSLVETRLTAVRNRRMAGASFIHERQVLAEAEALALVEFARSGRLELLDETFTNGFFVSNTAFLNQLSGLPEPVTMRPTAALHWISTLRPVTESEAATLHYDLLWELEERRMNFVDKAKLVRSFGPLISASQERLAGELARYHSLTSHTYGEGGALVVVDLDAPVVLQAVRHEIGAALEAEVARQAAEIELLRREATISEEDRAELEEFRQGRKSKLRHIRRTSTPKKRSKRKGRRRGRGDQ